jgi:hypothetical protein
MADYLLRFCSEHYPNLTIDLRAEHDSFARVLQALMSFSIVCTVIGP